MGSIPRENGEEVSPTEARSVTVDRLRTETRVGPPRRVSGRTEVDVRSCLSASAKGSQRLVLMAATKADVPTAMRKADEVERGC